MALSVTDTLTGETEPFDAEGDEVLLYVCGLTVSDDAHLGHARVWTHADVLHRWLEHEGYTVRHVENVTDVNEKIAARVGEDGLGGDEAAVARQFTAGVLTAMRGLNLRRADVYPRVSEHVPEVIELVERLVDRGYAYESNGSVYFDVSAFDDYGALSNQSVDDAEARADPEERAEKRSPADFALWKAGGVSADEIRDHANGDVDPERAAASAETWDSPWGEGRPGWHVECSAMATTHLGDTIDVHMGGRDLVFPHHENEIAQSEAATGEQFARYWLHVGLLEREGAKMSSSLGNFLAVSEALDRFGPNVLRTFYLGAAYGTRQTYSETTLSEAEERWERLSRAYDRATAACDSVDAQAKATDADLRDAVDKTRERFVAAMNDDLNVRAATAALLDLATATNRHVETVDPDAGEAYDYRGLRRAVEAFVEFGESVFGLRLADEGESESEGEARIADELVERVLRVREDAREAGEYDRADELRAALGEAGVEVEDGPEGPSYRYR